MKKFILSALLCTVFFTVVSVGIYHTTEDTSYAVPSVIALGVLFTVLFLLFSVGKPDKRKKYILLAAAAAGSFAAAALCAVIGGIVR